MKSSFRVKAATWVAVLALTSTGFGCSDDPAPTAPVEEPMDVPRVTETFTGTFGQGESSNNVFTVSQTGGVELRITKLEPVRTLTVGMGIGNWDESLETPCQVFASDSRVVVNAVLVSLGVTAGEYCVQVRDVGNVFPGATVSYTVQVLHP